MDTFMITARRKTGDRFDAEPGPARYLRIPDNVTVPTPAHVAPSTPGWFKSVQERADDRHNPKSVSPKGDVLVFVHGFKVTMAAALAAQRILQRNLEAEGWKGVVVGFDWPSDNHVLNYIEDRRDGAEVAGQMVTKGLVPLMRGQKAGCETNVHVLAHSAGAYVVHRAFRESLDFGRTNKLGNLFASDWRVGQVAFISADISADSLSADAQGSQPLFRRIMRLTNYQNPFDHVLGVSNAKRLGVSPRVGRVGTPVLAHSKTVNVNCGEHFRRLAPPPDWNGGNFPHSWYVHDRVFCRDLAMTLEGAIDRNAIPTRVAQNGLHLVDQPRPEFMEAWGDLSAIALNGQRAS